VQRQAIKAWARKHGHDRLLARRTPRTHRGS
jgi:hypothetical protein